MSDKTLKREFARIIREKKISNGEQTVGMVVGVVIDDLVDDLVAYLKSRNKFKAMVKRFLIGVLPWVVMGGIIGLIWKMLKMFLLWVE